MPRRRGACLAVRTSPAAFRRSGFPAGRLLDASVRPQSLTCLRQFIRFPSNHYPRVQQERDPVGQITFSTKLAVSELFSTSVIVIFWFPFLRRIRPVKV